MLHNQTTIKETMQLTPKEIKILQQDKRNVYFLMKRMLKTSNVSWEDRPIDTAFETCTLDEKLTKLSVVVGSNGCDGCVFKDTSCDFVGLGACAGALRNDKTSVIFKKA